MDPPADGCLLCASTWGNWWEDVDGASAFFCCESCAAQWKTIREEAQRAAGWDAAPTLELGGNRWGRHGVARSDGASMKFTVAFTPEGRLRHFRAEPVVVPPPPAPATAPTSVPTRTGGKETLDPRLEERLVHEAEAYPDLTSVGLDEARGLVREVAIELEKLAGGAPSVSQLRNTSFRAGDHRVPARVYTPTEGEPPFPVVVWFHGGGFAFGDLDTSDAVARELANRSAAVVVSVGYRRAPEAKFPAAVDDATAAITWLVDEATAERFEIDPARLAIAGDDAGGNLAAVVSQRSRAAGGPALLGQVLLCPILERAPERASYTDNGSGFGLESSFLDWMWSQYLPEAAPSDDPGFAPGAASDVAGLAPALIVTAGMDPLRDEAEAYAAKLRAAGVDVHLSRYSGMIHGFVDYRGVVDEGWIALDEIGAWLRRRFSKTTERVRRPGPPG